MPIEVTEDQLFLENTLPNSEEYSHRTIIQTLFINIFQFKQKTNGTGFMIT